MEIQIVQNFGIDSFLSLLPFCRAINVLRIRLSRQKLPVVGCTVALCISPGSVLPATCFLCAGTTITSLGPSISCTSCSLVIDSSSSVEEITKIGGDFRIAEIQLIFSLIALWERLLVRCALFFSAVSCFCDCVLTTAWFATIFFYIDCQNIFIIKDLLCRSPALLCRLNTLFVKISMASFNAAFRWTWEWIDSLGAFFLCISALFTVELTLLITSRHG